MKLAELIPAELALDDVHEGIAEISGLAYDSRRVRPGGLFFCVRGEHSDGHDFAGAAVAAGAAALVVERPLGLGVPEIRVDSVRAAMGPLAARFYGDPSAELQVVGITGTNGKTTTAFLVRSLLRAVGRPCGLLGTVTSIVGGQQRAVQRTTPEAIDLQADFRAMLAGGERACAMEVSSHALELGRTDGVRFAAAVFTNLTQDHLDFHGTMESYFQAKRKLFVPGSAATPGSAPTAGLAGTAGPAGTTGPARLAGVASAAGASPSPPGAPGLSIVNLDDPYGRRLAAELPHALTFAIDHEADYRAVEVEIGFEGAHLRLLTPAGERALALPLRGRFNVSNALGALAVAHALGGDLDVLLAALEAGVRVPGRLEPVDEGQGFAVLVDYAHTPDSLESVLLAARDLTGLPLRSDSGGAVATEAATVVRGPHAGHARRHGRLVCVFGAGGDRDRGKRSLMGEIAARLADVVIVTSDNPRSEDPEAIIAEILAGSARARTMGALPVKANPDRRAAIASAIDDAQPGDVLVIAGKGHEQGQELAGGRKIPFDDVQVAREALRARLGAAAGAGA